VQDEAVDSSGTVPSSVGSGTVDDGSGLTVRTATQSSIVIDWESIDRTLARVDTIIEVADVSFVAGTQNSDISWTGEFQATPTQVLYGYPGITLTNTAQSFVEGRGAYPGDVVAFGSENAGEYNRVYALIRGGRQLALRPVPTISVVMLVGERSDGTLEALGLPQVNPVEFASVARQHCLADAATADCQTGLELMVDWVRALDTGDASTAESYLEAWRSVYLEG
jgi:hypothetical protein